MSDHLGSIEYSVVDVETTGLYPSNDRVVEVGVVRTNLAGDVTHRYTTLVNPGRDVGPTSIHGISARMVDGAPQFVAVAGDILHALADAVVVGHNISFDFRFLKEEFSRLGYSLRDLPCLCTMQLSHHLGPSIEGHTLEHVCAGCGVSLREAHTAVNDAEATAKILSIMLSEAPDYGISRLQHLNASGLIRHFGTKMLKTEEIPFRPSGISVTRSEAKTRAVSSRRGFIQQLVGHLHPTTVNNVPDEKVGSYLHILDRILEDRKIDEAEKGEITSVVSEWGFAQDDVRRAHDVYLGMMVGTALDDGVVTDTERRDLTLIASLLDISEDRLNDVIAMESDRIRHTEPRQSRTPDSSTISAGTAVCFTGETAGPNGRPMPRSNVHDLVEQAGLVVKKGVSKKLDVLVVADPDSQSGKARKAREYNIRLMAAPAFWRAIDHLLT